MQSVLDKWLLTFRMHLRIFSLFLFLFKMAAKFQGSRSIMVLGGSCEWVGNGGGGSGTRVLCCGCVTYTGHYSGGLCYLSTAVVTPSHWLQATCLCSHWCSGSHHCHVGRYLPFPQDVQWWQRAATRGQRWFGQMAFHAAVAQGRSGGPVDRIPSLLSS